MTLGRLRRALVALVVAGAAVGIGSSPAVGYTLIGTFPAGGAPGVNDFGQLDRMAVWQGKRNAIVNVFPLTVVDMESDMNTIWNTPYRSVPMVSYGSALSAQTRANPLFDALENIPLALAFRRFASGADGVLNTGDDRRAYLRYMYEPNNCMFVWSPCQGNPGNAPNHFRAAWQHVRSVFASQGLTSNHVQWVFSVARGGGFQNLYPGNAHVDWLGFDTYSVCGGDWSQNDGTLAALRTMAPGKPMSVNEWGVSSLVGDALKNQRISEFFQYLSDNDIRMSVSSNVDYPTNTPCPRIEKPYAFFGQTYGDETFSSGGRTFQAFSAYRQAVGDPSVIGSNPSNPRLLTDAQFKGQ